MNAILEVGEKLHVIHRQLFEADTRRHFIGTVEALERDLARVTGYLFALDPNSNQFRRHESLRTRLLPLNSANLILNILPRDVTVENVQYQFKGPGTISVADGSGWVMDLSHL